MPKFWLETQRRLLDEINCVGDENRRTLECPTSFSAEIEATPIGKRIASTCGEEGYALAIVSVLTVLEYFPRGPPDLLLQRLPCRLMVQEYVIPYCRVYIFL